MSLIRNVLPKGDILIKELIIVESESLFPYHNQAVEASLLDYASSENMILYIWANDKTVFIGKNQNAFTECNISQLRAAGGYLARRISGGGAVYHDKGNLNFTFVARKENYSACDNFRIVLNAVRSFGLDAELSGRNDCLIDGKKFSGNAFYTYGESWFHHGTILINTLGAEIGKYLNVSKVKLATKGVKSVVSRVTNLAEFSEKVTYSTFSAALKQSFIDFWRQKNPKITIKTLKTSEINGKLMDKWQEFFSNDARILGDDIGYNFRLEQRFEWGVADVRLLVNTDGIIEKAKIYTDSLDCDILRKEKTLLGKDIYAYHDCEVSDILFAVCEAKLIND